MADRDTDVGWACIPAREPGGGVGGPDYVSMSGGGGYLLNPNTKYPQQAWELLQFIGSADAINALLARVGEDHRRAGRQRARCWPRTRCCRSSSQKVLPVTHYRPGLAVYPQVSQALQQATADIVSGKSVEEAAEGLRRAVEKAVGGADKVSSS